MKKRIGAWLLAAAMLLGTAACQAPAAGETTQAGTTAAVTEAVTETETTKESGESKDYTGSSQGYNGQIAATITVVDGQITACRLEGPGETENIGGAALPVLEEQVVEAGSAEIEGVSGASYTSKGAREAVQAALDAANGLAASGSGSLSFTAGTYSGEAYGNVSTVCVEVSVSEDAITEIALTKQGETPILFDAAWDSVRADILEHQSLAVDMVSGASVSSRAIVAAVEDALTKAGADLAALKAPVEKEAVTPAEYEKTAQVVVVGGGGAGLVAAISAVEQGASVIVLEKAPFLGGNLTVFGGIYNTPDPQLQSQVEMSDAVKASLEAAITAEPVNEEHQKAMEQVRADYEKWQEDGAEGLFDSAAWFSLQTWNSGDKVAKKELVDLMCTHAFEGYEWLKSIGVEFEDGVTQGAGSLYQRTHGAVKPNGSGFIDAYVETLEKTPESCEILTETQATEFIMDGNAVIGVRAVDADGNTYAVYAESGVVLATGGFAGNVELRQRYCEGEKWEDLGEGVMTTNLKSVTGDGIVMAEAIGAAFVDMDQIQLLHLGNPFTGSTKGVIPYKGRNSNDVIFVNANGERFVAEDGRRDVMCNAIIAQEGAFYWLIHDSADIDPYSEQAEEYLKGGYMYRAETLEELAGLIGVPAENLAAAVEEYNAAFDSGVDEHLGRTLFTLRLENGPWFAVKRVASAHHTMGGVEINTEAQVLYPDGSAIPGLFAAGEVCGGIHGGNRVGGNAVDDTVVFGRIAGQNAAGAR